MRADLAPLEGLIKEPPSTSGESPKVLSIFVPTEPKHPRKAPLILKSQLRDAQGLLRQRGLSEDDTQTWLSRFEPMVENPGEWTHGADGAAFFATDEGIEHYPLPFEPSSEVLMSGGPFLVPMLPLLGNNGWFYILTLSQKKVRLFEANRDGADLIETPDLPHSLTEALGSDYREDGVQMRSGVAGSSPGGNVYHGHGGPSDDAKAEITRFCQRVDEGLKPYLRRGTAPMVLAGVDYVRAIYRDVSHYPALLEDGVSGNPDTLDARQLHERAWPTAELALLDPVERAKIQVRETVGTDRGTTDLATVLAAAETGRVDLLLVARGAREWGRFDAESARIERGSADDGASEELLNRAVLSCLRNSGTAFEVDSQEMPDDSPVAAVLRY